MKNFYLSALMLSLSAAPVFAQETAVADDFSKPYECQVEMTTANSSLYRWQNNAWTSNSQYAKARIVSQTSPAVSITIASKANNASTANNAFILQSGQVATSVYNVASEDPDYYVASFSFEASTTFTGINITIGTATEATTVETTAQIFEGNFTEDQTASFTIKGTNKPVSIPKFTVTLRRRSMPATSGWYLIKFIKGNVTDIDNNYVVNANNEFFQTAANQYALKFVSAYSEEMPANKYIYINVGNKTATTTTVQFKSTNGHYINSNCTSARNTNSNTTNVNIASMTTDTAEEGYVPRVTIGGYWSTYAPTNGAENPYVGQSSKHPANRYEIVSADPSAEFDIWTVSILNTPDAASVTNDASITCNSPANKGIAKVYNNGNYFTTKGAELTAADFTFTEPTNKPAPLLTIDNEAKTITVDYSKLDSDITRAELLEQTEASFRSNFGSWLNSSIFSEKAEEIISKRLEEPTAAIGDDDEFTDEEVRAFRAISLTPSAADILAMKTASVGKHVIFVNPLRNNAPYIYANSEGAVKCTPASTQPVGLNGIWVIDNCDETGKVSMYNYSTGKYITIPAYNSACNVADEPAMISVDAQTIENKHVVVIYNSLDPNQYLHARNDGNVIGYSAGLASSWYAHSPELDDYSDNISAEITKDELAGFVLTLTHADGVSLHDGYHETLHAIKVSAKQPATRAESDFTLSPSSLQHDADNNSVTLQLDPDNNMTNGNTYEIELPLALVKVGDNKFSRPVVATIELDENGDISTGIKEFDAARNETTVIFDLQGRRLNAPVKGINIINGRKVLVK
ncbi:MAG: hypothetical protein K2I28_07605 [Muribaculaceae bacterium]|nr:hypothetical protein [Muribaculaceae bacterium]